MAIPRIFRETELVEVVRFSKNQWSTMILLRYAAVGDRQKVNRPVGARETTLGCTIVRTGSR